jgi:acyl-coenzyme A thioesterase PaaI-like protein
MQETAIQDYFEENHAICYGCGRNNSHGLKIRTHWDGRCGRFRFTPEDYHTAFPGIVYGGLIASLFDCHCIGTAIAAAYDEEGRKPGNGPGIMYVTANLNVDYKRPTPMDTELLFEATIAEIKGRKAVVECDLTAKGQVCATARVVAVRMPE